MAAHHLYCFTADGGIPVFSKSKGKNEPLPFPVIGGFNGLDIFAENHNAHLCYSTSDDNSVVWKVFQKSLRMVLIRDNDDTDIRFTHQQLVLVFNGLILMYGLENLVPISNIEKLKKEIKVASCLVNTLLEGENLPLFCDVTQCVDVLACPENSILQSYLEAFCEAADSPYGCLYIHGKTVAATRKWWNLTSIEKVLLSILQVSLPVCSFRDVPIYLPKASPKVPHRLLTFHLVHGVEVWLICGPKPSLAELEREVGRFWRTAFEPLKAVTWVHPRNLPVSMSIDQNILALLIVNTASQRCLHYVPDVDGGKRAVFKEFPIVERRRLLRTYYKMVVADIFDSPPTVDGDDTDLGSYRFTKLEHVANENYMVAETHKLYASRDKDHQLFVLYTSKIPTFAMRSVTKKLLECFIKDKNIQFILSM